MHAWQHGCRRHASVGTVRVRYKGDPEGSIKKGSRYQKKTLRTAERSTASESTEPLLQPIPRQPRAQSIPTHFAAHPLPVHPLPHRSPTQPLAQLSPSHPSAHSAPLHSLPHSSSVHCAAHFSPRHSFPQNAPLHSRAQRSPRQSYPQDCLRGAMAYPSTTVSVRVQPRGASILAYPPERGNGAPTCQRKDAREPRSTTTKTENENEQEKERGQKKQEERTIDEPRSSRCCNRHQCTFSRNPRLSTPWRTPTRCNPDRNFLLGS